VSTWHQAQGQIRPLWHVSKWTAVSDKPNSLQSIMTFETHAQAKAYAEKTGGYLLRPASGGRTS
jgi:hypothetical protein